MTLILAILSVLMLWVFLGLLVIGLLLILKSLESVRTSLEKITAGVRAIEQETAPLGRSTTRVTESLSTVVSEAQGLPDQLEVLATKMGTGERTSD